jgi:capsular polysaccharide biosynthesis protein
LQKIVKALHYMPQMPAARSNSPQDVLRLFANSIKLIILTGVTGALIGFLAFQFMHPRWVAKMTVQVGQVSSPVPGGVVSRLVENQLTAADRYNLPTLRLAVLSELGLPAPDTGSREANLIFDTLRGSTGKSPDLINLQVSAYSREQAAAALNMSFKTLADEHRKLFDPAISRMKNDLSIASDKLKAAEREYASSYAWLESGVGQKNAASNSARDVLLTNMAMLINNQVIELRQQATQLREALEPTRSYPTRAMGEVYIPERPSTPGRMIMIIVGAFLGLMVGAAFVVLRNSSRS